MWPATFLQVGGAHPAQPASCSSRVCCPPQPHMPCIAICSSATGWLPALRRVRRAAVRITTWYCCGSLGGCLWVAGSAVCCCLLAAAGCRCCGAGCRAANDCCQSCSAASLMPALARSSHCAAASCDLIFRDACVSGLLPCAAACTDVLPCRLQRIASGFCIHFVNGPMFKDRCCLVKLPSHCSLISL